LKKGKRKKKNTTVVSRSLLWKGGLYTGPASIRCVPHGKNREKEKEEKEGEKKGHPPLAAVLVPLRANLTFLGHRDRQARKRGKKKGKRKERKRERKRMPKLAEAGFSGERKGRLAARPTLKELVTRKRKKRREGDR